MYKIRGEKSRHLMARNVHKIVQVENQTEERQFIQVSAFSTKCLPGRQGDMFHSPEVTQELETAGTFEGKRLK